MLTVTDGALEELQTALRKTETPGSRCFRFTRHGDEQLGLKLQAQESSDQTFERDGTVVLAAPDHLAEQVSDRLLVIDADGRLVLLPKSA